MASLAAGTRPLEVACDESGWEGENLIGSNTDVFAHASVHVGLDSAVHAVQEVRDRIRSPATEYKANHLLRAKHRPVLEWMLGPSGPIHGHARVVLVDKTFVVVRTAIDMLTDGRAGDDLARTLYEQGGRVFGPARWYEFLAAANGLIRMKYDGDVDGSVDIFFDSLEVLHRSGPRGELAGIIAMLRPTRGRAGAYRGLLHADPSRLPALDPLTPAIVRAARHWTESGDSVSIVHDRQNTLTEDRIDQIMAMFDGEPRRGRLTGLRLVEAGLDERVQLADFLAGTARKIAEHELNGRGDVVLTSLVRPYVDPLSVWGDDRSGQLLGVGPNTRGRLGRA